MKIRFLLIILGVTLFSCNPNTDKEFSVVNFNPFFNFELDQKKDLSLQMNLDSAFTQGVIIPSQNQDNQSFFKFSLMIKMRGRPHNLIAIRFIIKTKSISFQKQKKKMEN